MFTYPRWLTKDEVATFNNFFAQDIHFTISQKRLLIEYTKLVAAREKNDIKDILFSKPVSDIVNNKQMTRVEKGDKIFYLLYSLRYPVFSEKEKIIKTKLRSLSKKFKTIENTNVNIVYPKFFEGDTIKIEITCDDIRSLLSILVILEKNAPDIFSILCMLETGYGL